MYTYFFFRIYFSSQHAISLEKKDKIIIQISTLFNKKKKRRRMMNTRPYTPKEIERANTRFEANLKIELAALEQKLRYEFHEHINEGHMIFKVEDFIQLQNVGDDEKARNWDEEITVSETELAMTRDIITKHQKAGTYGTAVCDAEIRSMLNMPTALPNKGDSQTVQFEMLPPAYKEPIDHVYAVIMQQQEDVKLAVAIQKREDQKAANVIQQILNKRPILTSDIAKYNSDA